MPSRRLLLLLAIVAATAGCSNDPYPAADREQRILYASYNSPPRTLDPAVAYSVVDHQVTGAVYDTLLEYHYLKRPYELIPGLAESVPQAQELANGHVLYRFRLRAGVLYQDDPVWHANGTARRRAVSADDLAFAIARLADPAVNSPVISNFEKIVGFGDFSTALATRRRQDPSFAALPAHRQYAQLGGIAGVRSDGATDLAIELEAPYPPILFWFAMPFTAPIPWEAIEYYDGRDGRDSFADHPVGAGPFRLVEYDRRSRIVLDRNDDWYGVLHPEWKAPGATYPSEGESGDEEAGLLDARGAPLPFLDRIELRRDPESVPAFFKFAQGYYDTSSLIRESFDRFVQEGDLSPELAAHGMQLSKTVTPAVYYLGFNMADPVVGAQGGDRARALRQAMSLAIDTDEYLRIFANGRGIAAQSPLPPGIFGYDADYRNPYRSPDFERAAALLVEAGYPRGIDAVSGRPLHLSFDVYDTSARGLLQFQYFADRWRGLGLEVEVRATNYNQFQEKVRNGAYQLFLWGWVGDYPDPENFLFLLYGPMSRTRSGGPNTANFSSPRYDELFLAMHALPNDAERLSLIASMREILERERPWIELYHPLDFTLHHSWVDHVKPPGLSLPVLKYQDVDPLLRARHREEWNRPILWPAYLGGGLALAWGALTLVRRQGGGL